MNTPLGKTALRAGTAAAALTLAGTLLAAPASAAADAATAASKPALTSVDAAAARPRNGAVLFDRISGGNAVIKISNGTRKDAVVTLVRGKSKAISLYIRAKSKATYKGVRAGTYRIFFTTGYRFSTKKGRFARGASYSRFDRRVTFISTSTQHSIITLTLNTVPGGNARTSGINPKDFPA